MQLVGKRDETLFSESGLGAYSIGLKMILTGCTMPLGVIPYGMDFGPCSREAGIGGILSLGLLYWWRLHTETGRGEDMQ